MYISIHLLYTYVRVPLHHSLSLSIYLFLIIYLSTNTFVGNSTLYILSISLIFCLLQHLAFLFILFIHQNASFKLFYSSIYRQLFNWTRLLMLLRCCDGNSFFILKTKLQSNYLLFKTRNHCSPPNLIMPSARYSLVAVLWFESSHCYSTDGLTIYINKL